MSDIFQLLPQNWRDLLKDSCNFRLSDFVEKEYSEQKIFPPRNELFNAFRLTSPEKVKVVILGQDPYHEEGQAHGLAFSVKSGVKHPASLRNIFKECHDDVGKKIPESGSLESWAEQGVLLLNTVLTVRAHQANSHAGHGWEMFTDSVIRAVDELPQPIVFVLWGAPAQKKAELIKNPNHRILKSAHPSPLSAWRGFFGSRPFSEINRILAASGSSAITW